MLQLLCENMQDMLKQLNSTAIKSTPYYTELYRDTKYKI